MTIINLTSDEVYLYNADGWLMEVYQPNGTRVLPEERITMREVGGVPIAGSQFVPVHVFDDEQRTRVEGGLPDLDPDVYYIVDNAAFELIPRADFLTPDMSVNSIYLDTEGRVMGVKRFWGRL